MKTLIGKAVVARRPQLFKGVKVMVLPNQTMSLKEMLRRFVRREVLPVEKQGIYYESDYDLEKLAKEDRVDQEAILSEMKEVVAGKKAKAESALKAKRDKEEAAAKAAEAAKQSDPKEGKPSS